MSLIQSAINQIGREIGRDLYKNRTSIISRRSSSSTIYNNETILSEISDFKMASYDKVSVRNLANLTELTNKLNPNSFTWEEAYVELDKKIDFAKEYLDKEHLNTLEELDFKNFRNHELAMKEHKKFVQNEISSYEDIVIEFKNKNDFVVFFLSMIGMGRIYFKFNLFKVIIHITLIIGGLYCAYHGWKTYEYPELNNGNLPIENKSQIQVVKYVGILFIAFGAFIYLITVSVVINNFKKQKKNFLINQNYLDMLKQYYVALK